MLVSTALISETTPKKRFHLKNIARGFFLLVFSCLGLCIKLKYDIVTLKGQHPVLHLFKTGLYPVFFLKTVLKHFDENDQVLKPVLLLFMSQKPVFGRLRYVFAGFCLFFRLFLGKYFLRMPIELISIFLFLLEYLFSDQSNKLYLFKCRG